MSVVLIVNLIIRVR